MCQNYNRKLLEQKIEIFLLVLTVTRYTKYLVKISWILTVTRYAIIIGSTLMGKLRMVKSERDTKAF